MQKYDVAAYIWPAYTGREPQNFEKHLRAARAYLDAHPDMPPLVTVNSWNEWTETSYLQPDDRFGYGLFAGNP